MNYAKYVFLALTVLILSACGNGSGSGGDSSKLSTSGLDEKDPGGTISDQRPLIRAHFDEVFSATVQRRVNHQVLPMLACRIDDPNNCVPPVYKEVVNVHIDGTGSAGDDQLERPLYLQSLSVDFALEIEGSRRCLDQAIAAIARNASLDIYGRGELMVAIPATGGGSSGGGTVQPQGTISDRPIWGSGFTNVAYDALKACEVTERPTRPPVLEDPTRPPVQPQPAATNAD